MGRRVKFYSASDLSIGFYLDRFRTLVDSVINNGLKKIDDVNDTLELLNIIYYIDNVLPSIGWDEHYIEQIKSIKPLLRKAISEFFTKMPAETLISHIRRLDFEYIDDFFNCFKTYRLAERIKEMDFKNAIIDSNIPLYKLLRHPYLTKAYKDTIKEIFMSDPNSIELIVGIFSSSPGNEMSIPDNISKQELQELCCQYIANNNTARGLNYLRTLSVPVKGIERYFTVTPRMRLEAKKQADIKENSLFGTNSPASIKYKLAIFTDKVAYDKATSEPKNGNEFTYHTLVDRAWVDKYHDFPTLLNNVQYLYDFFTDDFIVKLVSFPQETSTFDRLLLYRTTNSYVTSIPFDIKQQLAIGRMQALVNVLDSHNIRVEDIIDWFFSTYCKEVFDIKWLPLDMPSVHETTANRTSVLFRVEESIRTQYYVLVDNGKIDRDLVGFTPTPLLSELQSLISNKYVYLTDEQNIQNIVKLLFGDQSGITYIDGLLRGRDFFALILNNQLNIDDFHDYQKPSIQYLINNAILKKSKEGRLMFANPLLIKVLRQLYDFGVISFHHIPDAEQKVIEKLVGAGQARFDDTLLAKQEVDYLNYILNNSKYDNSLGLRNKYAHGLPAYDDDNMYEYDNRMALLVLLLITIKINDDLSLKHIADGKGGLYCDIDADN